LAFKIKIGYNIFVIYFYFLIIKIMAKYLSEENESIVKEEKGVWYIIPIKRLRETTSVEFDAFPLFREINGIDIVKHEPGARSPSLPD
jgi:hypothetical protein